MRKIITIIFIALLLNNILYVFAGVLFHPLQNEDAIGIWLLKTKALYLEKGFPNHLLHSSSFNYSHQQYPLGLPFVFSLIYTALGGIKENIILLIYPFIYIAIILLAYTVIKRKTNSTIALIFTYIYSTLSPFVASGGRILAGGADIFLVLIEWIILFILLRPSLKAKSYFTITLLVMIASQIKAEGIFLSVILLFLPIPKKYKFSLFGISLIPFLLWLFTIYTLHIPTDMHIIFPDISHILMRISIIIGGIGKELVNINNWYLFWPIVGMALFIKGKVSTVTKQILLPSYGIIMALYILVYLFSSTDTNWYINSSFDRVLFQHSAIIFYFLFEKMGKYYKNII